MVQKADIINKLTAMGYIVREVAGNIYVYLMTNSGTTAAVMVTQLEIDLIEYDIVESVVRKINQIIVEGC